MKDVWPNSPLLGYFEFYFSRTGGPSGFDAEFPCRADDPAYFRTRNAIQVSSFDVVERGQTPTEFQRSTYPPRYRSEKFSPSSTARVWLDDHLFVPGDEIVTYSARSLEPHRGFHIFMRALPSILRRRPRAHVLIVGRGDACYSGSPAHHRSYAEQFFAEIENSVDRTRIHFVGLLPTDQYRAVLDSLRSREFIISWLNHTPHATAVYASCSALPPPHATLASRRLARPYLGRTCTG